MQWGVTSHALWCHRRQIKKLPFFGPHIFTQIVGNRTIKKKIHAVYFCHLEVWSKEDGNRLLRAVGSIQRQTTVRLTSVLVRRITNGWQTGRNTQEKRKGIILGAIPTYRRGKRNSPHKSYVSRFPNPNFKLGISNMMQDFTTHTGKISGALNDKVSLSSHRTCQRISCASLRNTSWRRLRKWRHESSHSLSSCPCCFIPGARMGSWVDARAGQHETKKILCSALGNRTSVLQTVTYRINLLNEIWQVSLLKLSEL